MNSFYIVVHLSIIMFFIVGIALAVTSERTEPYDGMSHNSAAPARLHEGAMTQKTKMAADHISEFPNPAPMGITSRGAPEPLTVIDGAN